MADPHDLVSSQDFRDVFSRHPAGVAVVTCTWSGEPWGFTATSVASVSASPPLLSFSLDSASRSSTAFSHAPTVAVSFLGTDQRDIARRFAQPGGQRFLDPGWRSLATGEPVIEGATSWVRGRVQHRLPVGGSRLFVVHVENIWAVSQDRPLVYWSRSFAEVLT